MTTICPNTWVTWEDWQAGLYSSITEPDDRNVQSSVALLSDPDQFLEVAREMAREWPNAAIHNVRHLWTGRRAWVGQASCMYAHGAVAIETRIGWGRMTNGAQVAANAAADIAIGDIRRGWQGAETLFGY